MGLFENMTGKGGFRGSPGKYIGDFEIVEVKDARGRMKKKARYTGVWTVIRGDGKKDRKLIAAAGLLTAAAAAAYLRMLTLTHLVSGQVLVMLPLLAGLFPGLYLAMGAFSLPWRGRPMRRDQYMYGMIRMSRSAAAAAVCQILGLVMTLGFRLTQKNWDFFPEDMLFMGLMGLITALCGAVIGVLRQVDVTEAANDAVPPEEALF